MDVKNKDIMFLSSLRRNSRDSLTSISKKINVPISTLFDRLRIHEKEVIKKHTAIIDFAKLGFSARANITMKVAKEKRDDLRNYLEKHHNVNSIYKINNGYDFLVECIFRNIKDLEDFIENLEERFKIKGIQVYYIIEDIRREEFMADPELAGLVCSGIAG